MSDPFFEPNFIATFQRTHKGSPDLPEGDPNYGGSVTYFKILVSSHTDADDLARFWSRNGYTYGIVSIHKLENLQCMERALTPNRIIYYRRV